MKYILSSPREQCSKTCPESCETPCMFVFSWSSIRHPYWWIRKFLIFKDFSIPFGKNWVFISSIIIQFFCSTILKFYRNPFQTEPMGRDRMVDRQEQKNVPILLGLTYGPNNTDLKAVKVREETFWQFSRKQFVWKCAYHGRYQLPRYLLPPGAKRKFTSKCFDALVAEAKMFLNCFVMPL